MNPQAVDPQAQSSRTVLEFGRLVEHPEPWFLGLVLVLAVAVIAYVLYMYVRDSQELRAVWAVVLCGLRVATFLMLLLIFLQPQWRTERAFVKNSRVVILADTSLSMALSDASSGGASAPGPRSDEAAAILSDGTLLSSIRKTHEVSVFTFDEQLNRALFLEKASAPAGQGQAGESPAVDWSDVLRPTGAQSRLSDAVRQALSEERTFPLSGLIVLTDGAQNVGAEPAVATSLAKELKVPIYAVGLGSAESPVNVRISDLLAPARAFPGDSTSVTAWVQASGMGAEDIEVELWERPADTPADGPQDRLAESQTVTLRGDDEPLAVAFKLAPQEPGRKTLRAVLKGLSAVQQTTDDSLEADVEIVDRKSRILIVSGGPGKEYQFLRNQLRRDPEVTLDVQLQTASGAVSQDASAILEEFPSSKEALAEYDAVVAIDPDWEMLGEPAAALLEDWVSNQSGGLVFMAGPVNTPRWVGLDSPLARRIKALLPVDFNDRFLGLEDARFGSENPSPLELTRDGLEVEFMQIEESALDSQEAWASFSGVYGRYAVRGPKPAATVYASVAGGGQSPEEAVYLASQFYGSGRCVFVASAEMWRLRKADEAHFERYYTKLVRFVSQGRLMRGSPRGVLLVERDRYLLHDTVAVRAQIATRELEPLVAAEVTMDVVRPDGGLDTVGLFADPARPGQFAGEISVRQEGTWRLAVDPDGGGEPVLTKRIQVRVPDREKERPERNDSLLSDLAGSTGGRYFVGAQAALAMEKSAGTGDSAPVPALAAVLKDRTQTSFVNDSPHTLWDNQWILLVCSGLLCLEWLIRRLTRLA